MTQRRDDIDGQHLASEYLGGQSIRMLAARFEASQPTIRRILAERGVTARSLSEAHVLRWERDREDALAILAKGAPKRGGRRTDEAMRAQARAKQRGEVKVGAAEYPLREHLASMGVEFVPQFAVDRYNIDIAIEPQGVMLAVEVEQIPHNPLRRPSKARRMEHLGDRGWTVLYVWCHNALMPERGAAERIIAHLDLLRREPSARGQHLVVRRNGEDVAYLGGIARPAGRPKRQPGQVA